MDFKQWKELLFKYLSQSKKGGGGMFDTATE